MKKILAIIFVILLGACKPINNSVHTELPFSTQTATLVLPTSTLLPTATQIPTSTPVPDVDLESFAFPYDVSQVTAVWEQLHFAAKYRYFTYHLVNRISRDIPYEDPCGYHPGDLIIPLGTTKPLDNFTIDVTLPYSGKLVDKWITQGGDDGFTFFIGNNHGKKVYLNIYHTTKSSLSVGQVFKQGDYFGSLTYTKDYGGWNETKVHLTLFNPAPNGSTDFLGSNITPLDITSYALPPTMQAMFVNHMKLLITYQGENWCNMTSAQKINAILGEYLPNAGFCVDGTKVSYCGKNDLFQGINFTQATYDERSVMFTPVNK